MFSWLGGGTAAAPEWSYPELPTPVNDEDYARIGQEALDERLQWLQSNDGWTLFYEEEGVQLFERVLDDSSIQVVKAVGELANVDLDRVAEFSYNGSFEEKKIVTPDIERHDVLKSINDNLHLAWSQYSTNTIGVYPREFITVRGRRVLDSGAILLAVQSINLESHPFSEGFVRGATKSGGLLSPVAGKPGCVNMISVDFVDPKGWIPGMVVSMFKQKAAKRVLAIQELFAKA